MVRVEAGHAGRRVDNLIISLLPEVPKSHIYRMLRRGEARLNGRRVRPEARVAQDDVLRLPPLRPQAAPVRRVSSRLTRELRGMVLHEDEKMLILNKPAGVAVHGGSGLRFGLIETLRAARPSASFLELAHRLDRDTSGCLIVAKDMQTLRQLHAALRAGEVEKRYLLLARGTWHGDERCVTEPLRRTPQRGGRPMVEIDPKGKRALTRFRLRRQLRLACLLEAELDTGRTHQIRVHAAGIGFPIAGDRKYGDRSFNTQLRAHGLLRLFLHAVRVTVRCGAAPAVTVEATLPPELDRVVTSLATVRRPA